MMLCTPRMTEIPVYCSLLVKYNLGSHSCNISLGYLGEISLKTYPDVNHLWNLCSYHILNLQNKTCRKTCWTNGYLIFFQLKKKKKKDWKIKKRKQVEQPTSHENIVRRDTGNRGTQKWGGKKKSNSDVIIVKSTTIMQENRISHVQRTDNILMRSTKDW